MCTSRWYKKFFSQKSSPFHHFFFFFLPHSLPNPPFSPFPYLPGPVFQNFLLRPEHNLPPTHLCRPSTFGLRPPPSAPCRFVDSGKRERGGGGEKRKGRENPYYLPPHHNPNPRRAGQSRAAPLPRQHIYNFHFIIIIDCLL